MNELLLQIDVLLLDVFKGAWVIDLIGVDGPHVLSDDLVVILSVVLDVFVLQILDETFQVFLALSNLLIREGFGWDISVIKVDANVLVLHLEISGDGRVGYDLFVALL